MSGKAKLVLADGTVFEGTSYGAEESTLGELVFTTGMTGYEEVLTDPSYCGQIVTMTAAHIGNTGTNDDDGEAARPQVAGFVIREASPLTSSWRSKRSLGEYLEAHGITAIADVDTRSLTRHLRDHGAQSAAIGTGSTESLIAAAKNAPQMTGLDLTDQVTTKEPYVFTDTNAPWCEQSQAGAGLHVVCIDFGVKRNILRCFADIACKVTVVPAKTSVAEIQALRPDGVFLSNGPGDPAAVSHALPTIRALLDQGVPLFGICLGHQLLCLALGGSTYKLKFGHRGINHPVKDLTTGKVEITTQNHGFCVDTASLEGKCSLTHVHLNDQTCAGFEHVESGAFGVQYHPEAGAGPHDSRYLFERFAERMRRS